MVRVAPAARSASLAREPTSRRDVLRQAHPCGVDIGDGVVSGNARIQDIVTLGGAETLSLIGFLLQSLEEAPMRADLRADFNAVVAAYRAMASREDHDSRVRQMAGVELALGRSCGDDDTAAAFRLIDA